MQKKYIAVKNTIHIGQVLRDHIDSKKIVQAALARKLGRSNSTIANYLKGKTMQSAILIEHCHALKHNFFADIAALLPGSYTTSVPPDTAKDERIAALEHELEIVKAEKEVLLKVVGK